MTKKIRVNSYTLIAPLVLIAVLVFVYWGGWQHYFESDDFCRLYQDGYHKQLSDLLTFFVNTGGWFYRPLLKVVYFLGYQLFELNAAFYHLVSFGVHVVNVLLAYALIFFLTRNFKVAFFSVLVWSTHAIHAGTVLWFANISELFSSLFILVGILFWLRVKQVNSRLGLWLTLPFFVMALLFKENALVGPLLLILVDWMTSRYSWRIKREDIKKLFIRYLPLVLLIAIYLLVRYLVHAGLGSGDYRLKPGLNVFANLIGYSGLFLFGPPFFTWQNSLRLWMKAHLLAVAFGTILILILLALVVWKRKKVIDWLRGYSFLSLLSFFVLWTGIGLLPVLGLGNVAERFFYLPSLGVAVGLVLVLDQIAPRKTYLKYVGLILVLFFTLSNILDLRRQIGDWMLAGKEAHRVLLTVAEERDFPAHARIHLLGPPDSIGYAFVLRNCFDEGLRLYLGRPDLKVSFSTGPSVPQEADFIYRYADGKIILERP